jgi:hypothetical protein
MMGGFGFCCFLGSTDGGRPATAVRVSRVRWSVYGFEVRQLMFCMRADAGLVVYDSRVHKCVWRLIAWGRGTARHRDRITSANIDGASSRENIGLGNG